MNLSSEGFSIIIPSWDNDKYLSRCIENIKKYSSYQHEILVHLNTYNPEIENFLMFNNIKYSKSKVNIGAIAGTNEAAKLATKSLIYPTDDDNMVLPEWDVELIKFANSLDTNLYWITPTVIEPNGENICCLAPYNYGKDITTYEEDRLIGDLGYLRTLSKPRVSPSVPCLISKEAWDKISGLSEEYGMGIGLEDDFAKKIWDIGCRIFVSVPRSLVYHFAMVSTSRLENRKSLMAKRDLIFKQKHGIGRHEFIFSTLGRGSVCLGSVR